MRLRWMTMVILFCTGSAQIALRILDFQSLVGRRGLQLLKVVALGLRLSAIRRWRASMVMSSERKKRELYYYGSGFCLWILFAQVSIHWFKDSSRWRWRSAHLHHLRIWLYAYFSDENLSFLSGKLTEDKNLDGVFLHVFESRRYDHEKPKDRIREAVQQLALINWLEEHIRLDSTYTQG